MSSRCFQTSNFETTSSSVFADFFTLRMPEYFLMRLIISVRMISCRWTRAVAAICGSVLPVSILRKRTSFVGSNRKKIVSEWIRCFVVGLSTESMPGSKCSPALSYSTNVRLMLSRTCS